MIVSHQSEESALINSSNPNMDIQEIIAGRSGRARQRSQAKQMLMDNPFASQRATEYMYYGSCSTVGDSLGNFDSVASSRKAETLRRALYSLRA